jgi:hypothetical protein
MESLSPTLKQLVEAGKLALWPTDADRARVLNAIHSHLAMVKKSVVTVQGSIGSIESAENWATRVGLAKLVGVVLVVVGVALLHRVVPEPTEGGNASLALSVVSAPRDSVLSTETESRQHRMAPPTIAAVVNGANGSEPSAVPIVRRNSGKTRDSLAEEVETLSRAEHELNRGRPESALSLLNEHERKFKNGILAEERTAARIQALCLLGREMEATALYGKLSSSSIYGKSARRICAIPKSASSVR